MKNLKISSLENFKNNQISYLIFGLGNPEPQYTNTRHNIGKIFVNNFAKELNENFIDSNKKLPPTKVAIFKPEGYMNLQGQTIKAIRNSIDPKFPIESIKVICDDLETEIGKVKFSLIGGDRGHNGLKSLNQALSSNEFEKIKIGIGRPNSKNPDDVGDYVLENFSNDHLIKIKESVFPKIIKAINLL